ncbi:hypothetical protein Q760_15990 [Cellulomonas cellasea DSM 20118]|uniref:Uncharacterized protein n=2 Tax=Cellulomonas cellasea TaxID=43670 RepID=A0A0A0B744_9CELL|nr:hypothetical protein Q760_15990 [Cellulomonas cellasea DSM 20118]GEA86639.1 hypothetical protein CCE01nite_05880 [Cellulomonas cellasea]
MGIGRHRTTRHPTTLSATYSERSATRPRPWKSTLEPGSSARTTDPWLASLRVTDTEAVFLNEPVPRDHAAAIVDELVLPAAGVERSA